MQAILKEDSINVPKRKLFYMLLQLVIMFILKLLVGSSSNKSMIGVEPCSAAFWVLSWLYVPISMFSSVLIGKSVLKTYRQKQALNYPFQEGDIHYACPKQILRFNGIGTFAGTAAAMFGIGGGVLVSPIFMSVFKMNILVANFTVSVMSAASATSSVL